MARPSLPEKRPGLYQLLPSWHPDSHRYYYDWKEREIYDALSDFYLYTPEQREYILIEVSKVATGVINEGTIR